MSSRWVRRSLGIIIVCALLLSPGLLFPAVESANSSPSGLAAGAGGVQIINADGYGPYPGTDVSLPTFVCATLPCAKDLQAKLDIPAATFPAYVQVFFVKLGGGWQNQVFSGGAPRSIMDSPHNLDLGSVDFSQYGIYVLAFADGGTQSTSWQYFQVQQPSPALPFTSERVSGTFKVVGVKTIA